MNVHGFVTEPSNRVHIFRDAHTVPFCLTADHISTCLMSLCMLWRVFTLMEYHVVDRDACSTCSTVVDVGES